MTKATWRGKDLFWLYFHITGHGERTGKPEVAFKKGTKTREEFAN